MMRTLIRVIKLPKLLMIVMVVMVVVIMDLKPKRRIMILVLTIPHCPTPSPWTIPVSKMHKKSRKA
jgi:hypothetical protein